MQPAVVVSYLFIWSPSLLINRMRAERTRRFQSFGRFMLRRPARLAILLSILALLILGVSFSVNYIRSNFVGTFGPDSVYANNNGSTSLDGVSLPLYRYVHSNVNYCIGRPVGFPAFAVAASRIKTAVSLATIWSVDLNSRTMSVRTKFSFEPWHCRVHSRQVSWSVMGGCGTNYTFERNTSCVQNGFSVPMNLYLNLWVANHLTASSPFLFHVQERHYQTGTPLHRLGSMTRWLYQVPNQHITSLGDSKNRWRFRSRRATNGHI